MSSFSARKKTRPHVGRWPQLERLEDRLLLALPPETMQTLPTGAGPLAVAVAPLDGDGRNDLVALGARGELTFAHNAGDDSWTHVRTTDLDVSATSGLTVARFNADVFPDLAIQRPDGIDLFAGDGAGGFSWWQTIAAVPPGSLAPADGGAGYNVCDAAVPDAWHADDVTDPQDVATEGTHLWLVDAAQDRVLFYAGGAAVRSGSRRADSRFRLAAANTSPAGLATDGDRLWVCDHRADAVFVYTRTGHLEGSWQLDPANGDPSGLTFRPGSDSPLWVADRADGVLYYYPAARGRRTGGQAATGGARRVVPRLPDYRQRGK